MMVRLDLRGPKLLLRAVHPTQDEWRWVALAVLCGAFYFGAARLGLALRFPDDSVAALLPGTAVLIVALLLAPPGRWWMFLLAFAPAHVAAYGGGMLAPWRLAAQIAWNAGFALAAVSILRWRVGARHPFGTTRNLGVYLFATALVLPAVAALAPPGTIAALLGAGASSAPSFGVAWRAAFLANALSVLALVPAMALWALHGAAWLRQARPVRVAEAAGIGATAAAVCLLAFWNGMSLGALYALLVPLLWAAARFGTPGVASVNFLIVLLTTTLVVRMPAPFVSGALIGDVRDLQMFLLSVALPMLILGVVLDERAADVAALRDRTRALADSEARLRLALGAGRMGAWDWDPRRNTMWWSAEQYAIMGCERAEGEIGYRDWAERVHPDDLPRCESALMAAIADGTDYQQEYRLLPPSGEVRWVEARAKPCYDDGGRPFRMMGLIVDVTERKRIEQALQASEARYRAVVETQTELVCRYLPDTTLTFANEAFCRFLGRPREEVLGRKLLDLLPAESRASVSEHVAALCRDKGTKRFETELALPDGTKGWQQWVESVICAPDGSVMEVQGIGRDISDLKLTEQQLRESDERFRLVLRATKDVIFDWDMTAETLWWSSNGDALLGERLPEGRRGSEWLAERIHEHDRERVVADLHEAIERGEELWEAEARFRRMDGAVVHVRVRGCLVRDAGGRALRMLGSLMDITDSKRLDEANRRLAHAGRLALAGELTASIAHEINQPLSAILTNAETALMLLQSPARQLPLVAEILADIREDDLRASAVIGRLRSLLRDRSLEWERLDLNEIVREVVRLLHAEAVRRAIRVETDLRAVPIIVGDHVQIQQVLLNLLVNGMDSMADTPEGERRLVVSTRANGSGMVETRVRDTGCGIPPDGASRLFDSFYTTKHGGMGLGLSIVRSIVTAHGGRIRGENNADGRGATFAVELPIDGEGGNHAPAAARSN